jgi:single-strand selective monofunctional uracil DNA glycosylase
MSRTLLRITRDLIEELEPLKFAAPVTHVYNPLVYARAPHQEYIRRFARKKPEAVLLGMNPGPFGMAQTGVPFGEVNLVRDWLGIRGKVDKPENEHPKRPILGFDCPRSEVSGRRLWEWARDTFGTPERFFERFFLINFCPLVFMEESGRNRTPDKCAKAERERLYEVCSRALRRSIEWLQPARVIGVGNFAESRAQEVLDGLDIEIGRVLHPSPQSPLANRGWAEAARRDFEGMGIALPKPDPAG